MTDEEKVDHQYKIEDLVQEIPEIAQTLWLSIGTTDVHFIMSSVSKRNHSGLSLAEDSRDNRSKLSLSRPELLYDGKKGRSLLEDDFVIIKSIKGSWPEHKWLRIF